MQAKSVHIEGKSCPLAICTVTKLVLRQVRTAIELYTWLQCNFIWTCETRTEHGQNVSEMQAK